MEPGLVWFLEVMKVFAVMVGFYALRRLKSVDGWVNAASSFFCAVAAQGLILEARNDPAGFGFYPTGSAGMLLFGGISIVLDIRRFVRGKP